MKKISYYIANRPAEKGGDPILEQVSGYTFILNGYACAVRRTARDCWHVDHIATGSRFPGNHATRREALATAYANAEIWSDAIARALATPRNRSHIERLAQLLRGAERNAREYSDDFADINPVEIRCELARRETVGHSFADRVVHDAERLAAEC